MGLLNIEILTSAVRTSVRRSRAPSTRRKNDMDNDGMGKRRRGVSEKERRGWNNISISLYYAPDPEAFPYLTGAFVAVLPRHNYSSLRRATFSLPRNLFAASRGRGFIIARCFRRTGEGSLARSLALFLLLCAFFCHCHLQSPPLAHLSLLLFFLSSSILRGKHFLA